MTYHSSHESLKKRSEQMAMPMPEVQQVPPTPPTPNGISGEGVEYLLNQLKTGPNWFENTNPEDYDYLQGMQTGYQDAFEFILNARLDYPA